MFINILISLIAVLLLPYCVLILLYRKWLMDIKLFKADSNLLPITFFTIIIPARNEEKNIAQCIHSILKQSYPKNLFEIIVVDDYSNDNTALIVEQLSKANSNLQLIKLLHELNTAKLNAYKKKAIEIAIQKAQGNFIVTTDADCIVPTNWLYNFDNYIQQTNNVFIAAPVVFTKTNSWFSLFQYIDFMSLQAATAATVSKGLHTMCNGANLAYSKAAFEQVEGFKGIDNIASGDDMLLMNKMKVKFKNQIGYLFAKDSIVATQPMPTITSFINQRVRWASKADKYEDKTLLPVLLIVYLFNFSLIVLLVAALCSAKAAIAFIIFLAIKTIVEWLFMQQAAKFFGAVNFLQFTVLQVFHIIYIVVAGWLGKFSTYTWKDRKVQ